jgi:hypothetical protein
MQTQSDGMLTRLSTDFNAVPEGSTFDWNLKILCTKTPPSNSAGQFIKKKNKKKKDEKSVKRLGNDGKTSSKTFSGVKRTS